MDVHKSLSLRGEDENKGLSLNASYNSNIHLKVSAVKDELSLYTAILLMAIIIVVGTTGNIMVILAVKTNKKLQTVSNHFVVNLSICDLLFVTMVLPFNIYTYIEDDWLLSDHLCKFVGFLGYTLTGTTIITITLIAWNRYKLILDPAGFKETFSPRNLRIMFAFAWIFPIVCLLPALTEVWGKFGYVAMLVTCNLVLNHESQSFKLFLLIVRAVVPCIFIVYYYMMIYVTTRRSHLRLSRSIAKSALEQHNQRKEMHLTRMMITIFIVFIFSYFPCTISSVIDWNRVLSKRFHMFCLITVYVGSALNPLIYGLMNSQFRLAYFRLISCYAFGKKDQTNTDSPVKHSLNIETPIVRKKSLYATGDNTSNWNVSSRAKLVVSKQSSSSVPDISKISDSYDDDSSNSRDVSGSEVNVRLLGKSDV